ncbi:MAG: hypothetical protein K1X28_00355 [Parachlamydiales bacterium]|nr:hypothetical protein [Parachlamydiales bacterium]
MSVNTNQWAELLALYGQMAMQFDNPSQIAGNNTDPVDGIIQQLNNANPNWNLIKNDLEKLQTETQEIYNIGKDLNPASYPGFKELLESTKDIVPKMIQDIDEGNVGQFKSDFNAFLGDLGNLRYAILQGDGGNSN